MAPSAGRVSVGAMVVATPVLLVRAVALLKQQSARTTVYVEEGSPIDYFLKYGKLPSLK